MDDEKDRITTGGGVPDPEKTAEKAKEKAGALAWQEMLDGARKKVDKLESTRPNYHADDLDSLTHNITWNYSALMAYQDLDTILTATIRDDKEKGRNVDELETELERIRKRVQKLLERNNTTWNDFQALTEKQKQELEAQREREKKRELQQQEIEKNYLLNDQAGYIPLLNGEITNIIYNLSLDDFNEDPDRDLATCYKNGVTITIRNYKKFLKGSGGSASPLKILDAATAYLTRNNYSGKGKVNGGINPTVEIPLIQYAKTRGIDLMPRQMDTLQEQQAENKRVEDRKKKFKNDLKRDITSIENFEIDGNVTRGKNAGDYVHFSLFSNSSRIIGDTIRINFDPDAARYLINSYIMNYSPKLQSVDDRNPNSYRIGRKILLQNSIDNNYQKGTNNTLKVKTIIDNAPAIPTPDELARKKGQLKNWKRRIKAPVEKVLDTLQEKGVLIKWQYENPRTKDVLTPDQAGKFSVTDYINLNINFVLEENPDQRERAERKQAEKEKATAEKKPKPRKRAKRNIAKGERT